MRNTVGRGRPRIYSEWDFEEMLIELVCWASRLNQHGLDRTLSLCKCEYGKLESAYKNLKKGAGAMLENAGDEDEAIEGISFEHKYPSIEAWILSQRKYRKIPAGVKLDEIELKNTPTVPPLLGKQRKYFAKLINYAFDRSDENKKSPEEVHVEPAESAEETEETA